MKITKSYLKKVIKEELEQMSEADAGEELKIMFKGGMPSHAELNGKFVSLAEVPEETRQALVAALGVLKKPVDPYKAVGAKAGASTGD